MIENTNRSTFPIIYCMIASPFRRRHFYLLLNEIKVSLNQNELLFKKMTFNKHDIDIFINYTWLNKKVKQPSQGNLFAWIAIQREPSINKNIYQSFQIVFLAIQISGSDLNMEDQM